MKNELVILKDNDKLSLYEAAKNNVSEYEGFEHSYIKREREFLVLEQFKIDYQHLGDYDTAFRYSGDDGCFFRSL